LARCGTKGEKLKICSSGDRRHEVQSAKYGIPFKNEFRVIRDKIVFQLSTAFYQLSSFCIFYMMLFAKQPYQMGLHSDQLL